MLFWKTPTRPHYCFIQLPPWYQSSFKSMHPPNPLDLTTTWAQDVSCLLSQPVSASGTSKIMTTGAINIEHLVSAVFPSNLCQKLPRIAEHFKPLFFEHKPQLLRKVENSTSTTSPKTSGNATRLRQTSCESDVGTHAHKTRTDIRALVFQISQSVSKIGGWW